MAKKKKKAQGKIFRGNLPKIRDAINAVAKNVESGRKRAAQKVKEGKAAARGTALSDNLAANKAALATANRMLGQLRKAKTMMASICCQNDQGCDILVLD